MHKDKGYDGTSREGSTGDVGSISVRGYGMRIVLRLNDCSLNLWKVAIETVGEFSTEQPHAYRNYGLVDE